MNYELIERTQEKWKVIDGQSPALPSVDVRVTVNVDSGYNNSNRK